MPPRSDSSAGHREAGTASVELVAVAPFLLLALLVAAQLGIVGQALWSAGIAARAAARAEAVGDDARPAARRALPPALRPGMKVREADGLAIEVRVPPLLPGLSRIEIGARGKLDGG